MCAALLHKLKPISKKLKDSKRGNAIKLADKASRTENTEKYTCKNNTNDFSVDDEMLG